jgi:prepilin-type N-terminal cleavage/methylation domain-containing protein
MLASRSIETMDPRAASAGPRAFTLSEVLVVIAVLGVLIGILVPVLAGAKSAGGQTVTLSNLRQLGLTMADYNAAYQQAYPWAPADAWFDVLGGSVHPGDPWSLEYYWPALLHEIAPWDEHYATWVGPGGIEDAQRPWQRPVELGSSFRFPSYRLSHTFFARPELWAPATQDNPSFYRPVFVRDVAHPSSKAMFWDAEQTHLRNTRDADRDPRAILFADGHVDVKRLSEAATPPDITFKDTRPLQDTLDGARGRDY